MLRTLKETPYTGARFYETGTQKQNVTRVNLRLSGLCLCEV